MLFTSRWFAARRRVSRVRLSHIVGLESRTLLAASVTSNATSITVVGTTGDDSIAVGINGGGTFFTVNGVDTTVSTVGRTKVTINGLGGADTLTLEASLAAVNGAINGGDGADVLTANNSGINALRGNIGADSYVGGTGRDTLTIDQDDTTFTDQGGLIDAIVSSDATAGVTLILGAAGFERLGGTDFVDTINATGETVNVVIDGKGAGDILTGGGGKDTILGGAGDDIIVGGGGDDALRGDAGNDSIDGGSGIDTVDYATSTSGVTVDLSAGTASDGLGGTDSITLLSVENIFGSNFDDTLTGNSQANEIRGQGGMDLVAGLAGADTLKGNGGDDTVTYAASPSGVAVNLTTNVISGGDAAGDKIIGFLHITGSAFGDTLRGNSGINRLLGLAGNDIIDGEAGADLIDGGDDDDVITADSDDDGSALFTGGTGGTDSDSLKAKSDTVSVNWVLALASDFEIIQGSNNSVGAGDIIDASAYSSAVVISGRGGNDTLTAGGGADTLNGNDGDDTLIGGTGSDVLRGGNGNDLLVGGTSAAPDDGVLDRFFGDAGNDTARGLVAGTPGTIFATDTRNLVEDVIL